MAMDEKQLAGFIDHTLLSATATGDRDKKIVKNFWNE
jgi:deoxyribose-phosphate aldolase